MIDYETGEKVLKQVRKHWLPFLLELIFIVFLALVPLLVFVFAPETLVEQVSDGLTGNINVLFIFFYLLWLTVLWMVLFYVWTDYYLDVWIVTSHRIIDIEQKGFFNRQVSSFRLDRIQDITISINGLVPTMFGFGNIHVQTASADQNFIIPNASDPEGVKKLILEAYSIENKKGTV